MAVYATREILEEDEASFCVNAESIGSLTYDKRLPVKEATFEPIQERIPDAALQNRQNERRPGYLGVRECKVTLTFPWYGHNTAATGALTETVLHELLSDGLGGSDLTGVGGAVGATGPTAVSLGTNHTGTLTRGSVVVVGAKGDARGDGQAAVLDDQATAGDLLTALPAAVAAADVIYATQVQYPTESLSVTKRFLIGWDDTGAQYHALGCQLETLTLNIPIGGEPEIILGYRGAYWDQGAVTVPSGTAQETSNWAPVAGGSMFLQTVGTTTRATITPASLALTVELGLVPNMGPGGAGTYQHITGWERTMAKPSLEITVPWSTTYQTLFRTDGSNTTHKHVLFGFNPTPGRVAGFYLPRVSVEGSHPSFTDNDGLLYQAVTLQGREGTDTTNDLTRSAFRTFMG